jgi:DNA invertase Pin-like site-specific DNA recombinase
MIYGYIRVSTDKQTAENQRFEILKFAHEKKLSINHWIEETVSSTKKLSDRKLGALLERMHEEDILVVSELSRLGRSLLEVMSILHTLMEKEVKVFTTKERYELGFRPLPSGWGDTRTTRHGAALLTCWAVPPSTMSSRPR